MATVIETFVQNIMKDAGLDTLDEEFKKDYAERLVGQVERHIGIKAVQLLDDEGKKEYLKFNEKFLDKEPDPEEAIEFFRAHIENFDDKMKNVLAEFAQDFLLSMKK